MSNEKQSVRDIVGSGPLGYGFCIVFFVIFWRIDKFSGFASLYGDKMVHNVLAGILLLAGAFVFCAAFKAMPLSKHNKCLIRHGVYSYVRHPRYAATVFLIYPAFGLLLHSLVCLISTLAAYIIFRLSSVIEEDKLILTFKQDYKDYMKETPRFIPKTHLHRPRP